MATRATGRPADRPSGTGDLHGGEDLPDGGGARDGGDIRDGGDLPGGGVGDGGDLRDGGDLPGGGVGEGGDLRAVSGPREGGDLPGGGVYEGGDLRAVGGPREGGHLCGGEGLRDAGDTKPLLSGWVSRYDVVDQASYVIHYADPAAPANAFRFASAHCGLDLVRDALWWQVPRDIVTATLTVGCAPWSICPICLSAAERTSDHTPAGLPEPGAPPPPGAADVDPASRTPPTAGAGRLAVAHTIPSAPGDGDPIAPAVAGVDHPGAAGTGEAGPPTPGGPAAPGDPDPDRGLP